MSSALNSTGTSYYTLEFGILLAVSSVAHPFRVESVLWHSPIYAEQVYSHVKVVKHFY